MFRRLIGEATIVVRKVVSLPNHRGGASLARRYVDEVVAIAGMRDDDRDALLVIASELVTNAVIHGAEPVMLSVSFHESEITVEVADGDPRVESVGIPSDAEPGPGGRGLRIVASLADRWGIRRSQPGKTVWATKAVTLRLRRA